MDSSTETKPAADVAPVNRRFTDPPRGPFGRAKRWLARLAGQIRRQYLCRLRPGYVAEARARRQGECRKCGGCCNLTFHCPFLTEERCRVYEKRSVTCRDFPLDAFDLELTQVACGHWFARQEKESDVRIPLTKYGAREIVIFSLLATLGIALSAIFFWYAVPAFVLGLAFVLYFFRDPTRRIPAEPGLVVAPADGRVTEIIETEEADFLGRKAKKIGIFMSPLDVHLNRAPCDGRVEAVRHRPGRFLNAESARASAENESNAIALADVDGGRTRVLVRQVAGVVARRIVCDAAVGAHLVRGQRMGMIKFGSRTEVYVPLDSSFEVTVEIGQRVKAGETILGTFQA